MSLTVEDFTAFHEAVHGYPPFDWQTRLLGQVVEQRAWPRMLDLPTGAGKTTCIDIALFALALDARERKDRWCPRRIAMVVDRRIVVDQVAERGRKLLHALTTSDHGTVQEAARLLRSLSRTGEEPIGVFTLRGGVPKDDGWARAPDQPLVIASTVDQLGSRLLIQGYGVSPGMRPVHAGLVGNDLLLLLDEVHLSQPFAETLEQLERLRRPRAGSIAVRFHHAFLSATPSASETAPFRLLADETRRESPLGARLHAAKPVQLEDADGRTELELAIVRAAGDLIRRHAVIAAIVNRVASASVIVRQLREALGDDCDVVLLTGRMRPLDRDDLLAALRPRVATGRDRAAVERKLIVVGTQCLEAGADFDFDALVTEAASLDALRQRFGRVDRIGRYGAAQGVIVRDTSTKDDPVYGPAIGATASWLRKHVTKKTKTVDFGVLALPVPSEAEREALLAPKPRAPALLPAHVELWMHTSPVPPVVPDVGLWLHGPEAGPPDVQVIWRADLQEDDLLDGERAAEIVGAIPPSGLEAISVPFAAAVCWLRGAEAEAYSDVEGEPQGDPRGDRGRPALRWRGERSETVFASSMRPGDTIVVPSTRGGIREGCFDPAAGERVRDLAERGALLSRGLPVLRMHRAVLADLSVDVAADEVAAARKALRELAAVDVPDAPRWRGLWLARLATGRRHFVVDGDEPWAVLEGRRVPPGQLRALLSADVTIEAGIGPTTDDEDSCHAGRAVTLAEHSMDVEDIARAFAREAGLPALLVEDIALAAWLHDIGKADRRFQVMLRGGSEIEYYKDERPWAKSGMPREAKAAHRLARMRSRYPSGARHEAQSVAMLLQSLPALAELATDPDLVLHLVATHHGHCRPFAPAAVDTNPVEVVLVDHRSTTFGTAKFAASSDHGLHRLDAGIADRFWRVVARYGWLELCWLESILRLADHRASEAEQEAGDEA